METPVYKRESALEAAHWWFVGRRELFRQELEALRLPENVRVLDVGSGTGANLRLLREMRFTHVVGIDVSSVARQLCRDKGFGDVLAADVRTLPFMTGSFDLVLATDVVEHVAQHERALDEIARVLKPGGTALLTVPAFMSLWGFQDKIAHHQRRYRRGDFVALVAAAGLSVKRSYYFNFLLFAPIWIARQVLEIVRPDIVSENDVNNRFINAVLRRVFMLDVALARRIAPPFGVSFFVLATKA
jgi:SAM-dependent methyltransferase